MDAGAQNTTATPAPLNVDRELDELVQRLTEDALPYAEQSVTEQIREQLFARLQGDDADRFLFGMGRRLRRQHAILADLDRQRAIMLEEIDAERARVSEEIGAIASAIESHVARRRREGKGNTLAIPGVGKWTSRTVPAGFALPDKSAIVEALEGDDRRFVQRVEFDQLDDVAFKAHLEQLAARVTADVRAEVWEALLERAEGDAEAAEAELVDLVEDDLARRLPPGVQRRRARLSVSYQLS